MNVQVQTEARPGRNEPCPCGSGRKYKHCCLEKDDKKAAVARAKAAAEVPAQSADEAVSSTPKKVVKPPTAQPWKANTTRGFVPRSRTPRKVGGS
jgi:hypothetical protein